MLCALPLFFRPAPFKACKDLVAHHNLVQLSSLSHFSPPFFSTTILSDVPSAKIAKTRRCRISAFLPRIKPRSSQTHIATVPLLTCHSPTIPPPFSLSNPFISPRISDHPFWRAKKILG